MDHIPASPGVEATCPLSWTTWCSHQVGSPSVCSSSCTRSYRETSTARRYWPECLIVGNKITIMSVNITWITVFFAPVLMTGSGLLTLLFICFLTISALSVAVWVRCRWCSLCLAAGGHVLLLVLLRLHAFVSCALVQFGAGRRFPLVDRKDCRFWEILYFSNFERFCFEKNSRDSAFKWTLRIQFHLYLYMNKIFQAGLLQVTVKY